MRNDLSTTTKKLNTNIENKIKKIVEDVFIFFFMLGPALMLDRGSKMAEYLMFNDSSFLVKRFDTEGLTPTFMSRKVGKKTDHKKQ